MHSSELRQTDFTESPEVLDTVDVVVSVGKFILHKFCRHSAIQINLIAFAPKNSRHVSRDNDIFVAVIYKPVIGLEIIDASVSVLPLIIGNNSLTEQFLTI